LINQRKRVAKRLASGLMAGALALGGLAITGSSAGAVPVELDSDQRIGGADRYETSALIAEELEDQLGADVETVIVASGENFPDALAASSLSGGSAPIMLVTQNDIPSSVASRMSRFADSVEQVYVVGGTAAVSDSVFTEIEGIFDDASVDRLAGDNRYGTAAAIADELGYGSTVIIVSGESYADALSVGGYAAANGIPIVLANSSGLPDESVAMLEAALDEDADRAIILGGSSVVAASVEESLVDLGFPPAGLSRIAGSDRYVTNLLWNAEEFGTSLAKHLDASETRGLGGRSVMLMTGTKFADALSAAPLAATVESHIVLTTSTGGMVATTLAAVAATPVAADLSVDDLLGTAFDGLDFDFNFRSASLTDPAVLHGFYEALGQSTPSDYLLGDVWAIGGQSAVPDSIVETMDAAATQTVTCDITVDGGSDTDGPETFLISFSSDLQESIESDLSAANTWGLVDAALADLNAIEGASTATELSYLNDTATLIDVLEIDGVSALAGITELDLDNSGFTETLLVSVANGLDAGTDISFEGWDADVDDYGDIDPSTHQIEGKYLRNFDSCDTTVDEDDAEPVVDVYATENTSGVFVVEFSEELSDNTSTSAQWADVIEEDVSSGTSPYYTVNCQSEDSAFFACDLVGISIGTLTESGLVTLDAATYHDDAGNYIDEDELEFSSLDDADGEAPEVGDSSIECTNFSAGTSALGQGEKTAEWAAAYNSTTLDRNYAGRVSIPFADADLEIRSKSSLTQVAANDWTFTITHERGTMIPELTAEGTDVTIVIDKYVHTADDVARAINTFGRGGLGTATWAAEGDDGGLIDTDSLDYAYSTADDREQTHTCLITISLDTPGVSTAAAGGPNIVTAISDEWDIKVTADGNVLDSTDIPAGNVSFSVDHGNLPMAGYEIYIVVEETTLPMDSVTVQVRTAAGDSDDADQVTRTVRLSAS